MPEYKYPQAHEWHRWPVEDDRWYIYGLHLEGSNEIRYVGSTVNVAARYSRHMTKPHPSIAEWVGRNRGKVRVMVFEAVDNDPRGKEYACCAKLRAKGHRLLNDRRPRRIRRSERQQAMKRYMNMRPPDF